MSSVFNFSVSVDFSNNFDMATFTIDIQASSISQSFGITRDDDDVEVRFAAPLTAPEVTTLNNIVANFTPRPSDNAIITQGFLTLESQLADNQAIRINASDPAGGIDIDSGTGGITIDTSNTVSINAGAESNFSTSNGNLIFEAAGGLFLRSTGTGSAGINLGTNPLDQTLNIGTGTGARNINIGSSTGSTKVDIATGTGGFLVDTANGGPISLDAIGASSNFTLTTNADGQDLTIAVMGSNDCSLILNSDGTGTGAMIFNSSGGIDIDASRPISMVTSSTVADAVRISSGGGIDVDASGSVNVTSTNVDSDAIRLNTGGGIDIDATGLINLATGSSAGGAITLDAAFNNGGITISSGSAGIGINSGTGLIGIGHFSAGNMDIGTSATSRAITMGNTTGTTSITLNAGTGGITIGNNANGGEIQIGNVANDKTVIIGNSNGGSRLFTRWGTGGNMKFQGAETSLADSDATLTISQLLTQILVINPTANRTLTLPAAENAVSGISSVAVNDAIDFAIIHGTTGASDPFITIEGGTGATLTGYMEIHPKTNNAGTYFSSGSGGFRMRFTNVTGGTESYTCYRLS